MAQVTYVSVVPKENCGKLREALAGGDTGGLQWREQRYRDGSEFYFTGPPNLVRQTHAFVSEWVAMQKLASVKRRGTRRRGFWPFG